MNEPYAVCEHIKDDNERCGSPAMTGAHFCYFHRRVHDPRFLPGKRGYRFSALENAHSLEVTIGHVLQALLDESIDSKKAALLFRGLTLAYNAIRMRDYPNRKQVHTLPASLSHLVTDGDIASISDPDNAAWKSGVTAEFDNAAWKSGASAPRSGSAHSGALAPVDADLSSAQDCHDGRGGTSESDHPDGAQSNENVITSSAESPNRPQLSPALLAQIRKIIRQGPSHPKFQSCAAALDHHISSQTKPA